MIGKKLIQFISNELIEVAPLGAEKINDGCLIVLSRCMWIVPDGCYKQLLFELNICPIHKEGWAQFSLTIRE